MYEFKNKDIQNINTIEGIVFFVVL